MNVFYEQVKNYVKNKLKKDVKADKNPWQSLGRQVILCLL